MKRRGAIAVAFAALELPRLGDAARLAHSPAPGAASASASATAASWPTRPIRIVVPFPAGSSPDVVARLVFEPLSKVLGQPMVIDNRPGLGGNIGAAEAARADGDGYTFLYTIQGPLVTSPLLFRNLPYDPVDDFAPVTLVATTPNMLVVDPALNVSTLSAFVALARVRKSAMSFGSVGVGSASHLAMELFKARAGLELTHVPMNGFNEVEDAMAAGRVQAAIVVPASGMGPVRAGRLLSLGVTTLGRVASLPDMPTFAEQGYPGFESIAWHAVVAPADTPPLVLERMSAELVKAIKSDDVRSALTARYFSAAGTAPAGLAGLMQTERTRWTKVIKLAHVRVE